MYISDAWNINDLTFNILGLCYHVQKIRYAGRMEEFYGCQIPKFASESKFDEQYPNNDPECGQDKLETFSY